MSLMIRISIMCKYHEGLPRMSSLIVSKLREPYLWLYIEQYSMRFTLRKARYYIYPKEDS